MPRAGIEPARGYPRGILSPLRLPIPPPRQPLLSMSCRFFLGSDIDFSISSSITPCTFYILPDALLDELCKFRGFSGQTKQKNTGGIMRYQLRIFQLILIAFSTGYVSGLEED